MAYLSWRRRSAGFKEQFEDGREGRLVPPETLGHWAEVLSDWAEAPDALGRHADAMRTTRSLMPSWSEIARRTIGVHATARETWLAERDENAAYTQSWNSGRSLP